MQSNITLQNIAFQKNQKGSPTKGGKDIKLKKVIIVAAVFILGIADYFMYCVNELVWHSSRIEDIALGIMILVGAASIVSLLEIVGQEQEEQEERYRKEWLDWDIKNSEWKLLYGDDETCGQNLPPMKEFSTGKGDVKPCRRNL